MNLIYRITLNSTQARKGRCHRYRESRTKNATDPSCLHILHRVYWRCIDDTGKRPTLVACLDYIADWLIPGISFEKNIWKKKTKIVHFSMKVLKAKHVDTKDSLLLSYQCAIFFWLKKTEFILRTMLFQGKSV